MITLTFLLLLHLINSNWTQPSKSWLHQQTTHSMLNRSMSSHGRRPIYIPQYNSKTTNICFLVIILAGDIELNPGPNNKSVFPCGLCDLPVTWNCQGVCCDACDIWHHKSCIELCSYDYKLLERSNVQWLCCKCESINISTFTFRSYEIETSNIYELLSDPNLTIDSIKSVLAL